MEDNDVRVKRERLVACVLSGNSKMYLGKEYTEEQINEMDCTNVITLLNRYESVLSAQMTKLLGKGIINSYSNIALSKFDIKDSVKLVGIIALSDFTKDYLIKQKIIPNIILLYGYHWISNRGSSHQCPSFQWQ